MNSDISSPHDKFWKASLSDVRVASDYFKHYLPAAILNQLDLTTLELCPTDYVNTKLKLNQADVVYRAKMGGETSYLHLLAEQQSNPDPLMPLRLLEYNIGIWRKHIEQTGEKRLPLVVNIVFYNGSAPYHCPLDMRSLFNASPELIEAVWDKPFTLVDLNHITDEEMRNQQWFGVVSYFFRHARYQDALKYLKAIMPRLKILEAEDEGGKLVVVLLNYLVNQADIQNIDDFITVVKDGLSPATGEEVMTLAERLIERGIQQGIQQGKQDGMFLGEQKGKLEGEALILSDLLRYRFPNLEQKHLERLNLASEAVLRKIARRVLEAKTIEEIFSEE